MIRFITTEQTLAIRNEVLRGGNLSLEECRFQGDEDKDVFHLGYYEGEKLISIATFHGKDLEGFEGKAYQLRGMATLPEFRGRGFGNKLVNFAIVYLRGQKANYTWCRARKVAYSFYLQLGFEFVSDEYQVEGIGPHKTMYLKIQ